MNYFTTHPTHNGTHRLRPARPLALAGLAALILGSTMVPARGEITPPPAAPATASVPTPTLGVPAALDAPPALPFDAARAIPVGGPRMAEAGIVVGAGATALPITSARSWVVADARTGQVLAAKDPHGRGRPASTLKALLAITMLPRLDPADYYVADYQDTAQVGTRVGMVASQAYRISDLWYALFLRSGNDAANGLAKAGANGDLARGVRMMQAEARRIQANDTTVVNSSGLDEDGQFTSAYDLALWGRTGLQRRDFRTYTRAQRWTFPGNQTATATPADSGSFQVYNENRLIGRYPGAIGVKPGYTTKAQNTLIAAAERDGRTIIATLLGVPQGFITANAAALLDWGFANTGRLAPVGALVEPLSPAVTSAEDLALTAAIDPKVLPLKPKLTNQVLPFTEVSGMSWSTVAGGTLMSCLILLAGARVIRTRRRYRRFGALR